MKMMSMSILFTAGTPNEKILIDALEVAKDFVNLVDKNDASQLAKILHPEMMQFAKMGDKLIPF